MPNQYNICGCAALFRPTTDSNAITIRFHDKPKLHSFLLEQPIIDLPQMLVVTHLDLAYMDLEDQDMKLIALVLSQLPRVHSVNLRGNSISAAGLLFMHLSPTVLYLDVSLNNIGDAGACILAKQKSLLKLTLNNCGIGDVGAEAFRNSKLAYLILKNNNIGDRGALYLSRISSHINLDLTGNNIGDSGAKLLLAKPRAMITLFCNDNISDDISKLNGHLGLINKNAKTLSIQTRNILCMLDQAMRTVNSRAYIVLGLARYYIIESVEAEYPSRLRGTFN